MHILNLLPAYGEQPLEQITIEQARAMKKSGEAYFVNHGRALRLKPTFQQEHDRREQKGSVEEWRTVHASELCSEQRRAFGSGVLRVTTLQYNPS